MKRIIVAAAAAVIAGGLFAAPAYAGHCPKDVKKLEAAMSSLSGPAKAAAAEAAAKGLELHKAGKHGESLKVLHEGLKAAGVKH